MAINLELLTENERAMLSSHQKVKLPTPEGYRAICPVCGEHAPCLLESLCAVRQAMANALGDLSGACNEDERINHNGLVGVAMLRLQRAADPDAPAVVCECGPNPTALCGECEEPVCAGCWDDEEGLPLCGGCAGDEAFIAQEVPVL